MDKELVARGLVEIGLSVLGKIGEIWKDYKNRESQEKIAKYNLYKTVIGIVAVSGLGGAVICKYDKLVLKKDSFEATRNI